MRILHFIWGLGLGGAEAMLIDICNAQARAADVFIIVGNAMIDETVLAALSSNVKLTLLNRKPGSRNPWPIIKLNRIIRQINPEVIHCHNESALRVIWFSKAKKMLTIHDTRKKLDKMGRRYNQVFAISEAVKKDILNKDDSLHPITIPNGITLSKIRTDKKSESPLFRIVQIGRLAHEIKGQDILIRALHILIKQYKFQNTRINFIGDGASRGYLERMVRDLGMEIYVTFFGQKTRDYIYDHLCEYDLLAQPSRYEGFGLTVVEGMAAKVPVLVSNIEGPMEIIQNGKYGYFFEEGNPFHAAEVIKNIIGNYKTYQFQQLIEATHNYAKENFDIQLTADRYLNQYRKIM